MIMQDSQRKAMFSKINGKTSDKELIKLIKGDSKNFSDWYRNETNDPAYQEIERRNREIPKPKFVKTGKIFMDDPDAIKKQGQRVMNFENEQQYWKKIIKFPARDFHHGSQLGDTRWFALSSASTNLKEAKKKFAKLSSNKEQGITLKRNDTFKGGKKRFFFTEHDSEGKKIER